MSDFPNGVVSRADAIRLLEAIDGRNSLEFGPWDIDDFISIRSGDRAIDRCRDRVGDELIPLLSSQDEALRQGIAPLVSKLITELEADAQD